MHATYGDGICVRCDDTTTSLTCFVSLCFFLFVGVVVASCWLSSHPLFRYARTSLNTTPSSSFFVLACRRTLVSVTFSVFESYSLTKKSIKTSDGRRVEQMWLLFWFIEPLSYPALTRDSTQMHPYHLEHHVVVSREYAPLPVAWTNLSSFVT